MTLRATCVTSLFMHIRYALFIGALILVAAHSAIAQGPTDGWAAIKSKDGVVFVDNRPELHYTLEVKGKDIQPMDSSQHIFLSVDGLVFQIQVAELREFAPNARKNKLDDKAILAAHRDWEFKFLEGLLKSKLKIQSADVKLANGISALAWQFDMPVAVQAGAQKQLYLTIVSGDYIILLNAVADEKNSEAKARQYLLDTMGTLKISTKPIDVQQLANSLKEENP